VFKYILSENVDSCISCWIVYKDRYERVLRELDFTKKRLQKQHEEELEQEHNLKKAVEKRVSLIVFVYSLVKSFMRVEN